MPPARTNRLPSIARAYGFMEWPSVQSRSHIATSSKQTTTTNVTAPSPPSQEIPSNQARTSIVEEADKGGNDDVGEGHDGGNDGDYNGDDDNITIGTAHPSSERVNSLPAAKRNLRFNLSGEKEKNDNSGSTTKSTSKSAATEYTFKTRSFSKGTIRWCPYESHLPLAEPPLSAQKEAIEIADIFFNVVHGADEAQIWVVKIVSANRAWVEAKPGFRHPLSLGYVLDLVPSRPEEPTWVLKKTYTDRIRNTKKYQKQGDQVVII